MEIYFGRGSLDRAEKVVDAVEAAADCRSLPGTCFGTALVEFDVPRFCGGNEKNLGEIGKFCRANLRRAFAFPVGAIQQLPVR